MLQVFWQLLLMSKSKTGLQVISMSQVVWAALAGRPLFPVAWGAVRPRENSATLETALNPKDGSNKQSLCHYPVSRHGWRIWDSTSATMGRFRKSLWGQLVVGKHGEWSHIGILMCSRPWPNLSCSWTFMNLTLLSPTFSHSARMLFLLLSISAPAPQEPLHPMFLSSFPSNGVFWKSLHTHLCTVPRRKPRVPSLPCHLPPLWGTGKKDTHLTAVRTQCWDLWLTILLENILIKHGHIFFFLFQKEEYDSRPWERSSVCGYLIRKNGEWVKGQGQQKRQSPQLAVIWARTLSLRLLTEDPVMNQSSTFWIFCRELLLGPNSVFVQRCLWGWQCGESTLALCFIYDGCSFLEVVLSLKGCWTAHGSCCHSVEGAVLDVSQCAGQSQMMKNFFPSSLLSLKSPIA
jgi:hypothetical protein